VFDAFGDIGGVGPHEQGLYHEGTRHVSSCELQLDGLRPMLLSSSLQDGSVLLTVDLTNPDIAFDEDRLWPKGLLHVLRMKFLWQGACYERLAISNYGLRPVELGLDVVLSADFSDIFEVRGTQRPRRGALHPAAVTSTGLVFAYDGLDGVSRFTTIACHPAPTRTDAGRLHFDLAIEPRRTETVVLTIACTHDRPRHVDPIGFDSAMTAAAADILRARSGSTSVRTSNQPFDEWVERSRSDLYMMVTETSYGPYPYAGIPWFSTAFGRDGIIAAMSMLWADPELARGVLRYLGATQATGYDAARDAQPGKILHEARDGEVPALGEVPFGRYYGSVDATPLFVMLAGRYYDRTGDLETIRSLWPNIEAALTWMTRDGDIDGDGFVEYARSSERGLIHQGWKDSHDAIFHADGTPAEGPVALSEVQGYVYAARHHAAELARALGDRARARSLQKDAESLHRKFEKDFWCEDLGLYALALDGRKRRCEVVSSNAGQCLLSGIATPAHARRVAEVMASPEVFSGWGIRTIGTDERRYNPMSYHNGSVWPHDTALVAAGLARYGLKDLVLAVTMGLMDATRHLEHHRLPELFCGFPRRSGEGPTRYPIACAPQAWASASVYLLIQSLLGLEIDAPRRRIVFRSPRLPEAIEWLRLTGLSVGAARLDLLCERRGDDVGISVIGRKGDIAITTER